jgi:ribosomal protein L22
MKTLFLCLISLLVGIGVGWHFSRQQAESEFKDRVERAKDSIESSLRTGETKARQAAESIKTTEGGKAVKSLSKQIAAFYKTHAKSAQNDEQTKHVMSWIDQMAKTNKDIADAIQDGAQ